MIPDPIQAGSKRMLKPVIDEDRCIVGDFLRLSPVRIALVSDVLRSRFLATLGAAATAKGGADVLRM